MNEALAQMVDENLNSGMTIEEVAKDLGISTRTVYRYRDRAHDARKHLTTDDILEIKRELTKDYWGQNIELAKRFNVTPSTISQIKNGKLHADITG